MSTPKRIGRDCQFDPCDRKVEDGIVLWRVNPKGERGVFMCDEHARIVRSEAQVVTRPDPDAANHPEEQE